MFLSPLRKGPGWIGWAEVVLGVFYLVTALGAPSGIQMGFRALGFEFWAGIPLITAGCLLVGFAVRRLMHARAAVPFTKLSAAERGGVIGFLIGFLIVGVPFAFAPRFLFLAFGLTFFGWGPLGLTVGAIMGAYGSRVLNELRARPA